MRCAICKKTSEETTLYPGIQSAKMINICEECAEDQGIPIIKKPSQSQLTQADQTYSVRERLDRMSGRGYPTKISKDQIKTQRNLSKLKMPKPKQIHPDTLDNYSWTLNIARRRAKMTISQLAKKIDVTPYEIQEIERGSIPKNFKEIFLKLESFLGIKLLKVHQSEINFTRKNPNKEKELLKIVAKKMKNPEAELEEFEEIEEDEEKIDIEELKLSRKKDIKNLTLNDLIDRKRAREKHQLQTKQNEMIGDDIDIEEL